MLGRKLEQQFPEPAPVPAEAPTVLRVRGSLARPLRRGELRTRRRDRPAWPAWWAPAGRRSHAPFRRRSSGGRRARRGTVYGAQPRRGHPARPRAAAREPYGRGTGDDALARENVAMAHLGEVVRGFVEAPTNGRLSVRSWRASIPAPPRSRCRYPSSQAGTSRRWRWRSGFSSPQVLLADEPEGRRRGCRAGDLPPDP